MPGMGFQGQTSSTGAGSRARNASSPDSVILTLESNFCSLFSSASASVERCSFASDAHDRDSLASEISLHLAGTDHGDHHESSSGPDLDPGPNKRTGHNNYNKHSRFFSKGENAKVLKDDSDADFEDKNQPLDSARSSFSLALKECQDRRSRSEVLSKKPDRRRPASLDLNNVTVASSSPRLATMKKSSAVSSRKSGSFPSPGTPSYRQAGIGMQKGWSSERVPMQTSTNRRQPANAALQPFNNGRSTLPSKWEDAERWIFSPVSVDGVERPSIQPQQRRPKSKSGPLGPPGIAYYSMYSPAMPMFDGDGVAASPFGVIAADGLVMHSSGNVGVFPVRTEPCMARSVSVHGYSEMLSQLSLPGLQDEKLDGLKDAGTDISRGVSRRDMATQMSPEGSSHSSPQRRISFSASTPCALPILELQSVPSSKMEVRDVQVDEHVTVTRWSKKHRARFPGKSSEKVDDWKKKGVDAQSSNLDIRSISKLKREEAKITAWENLQKAKAEAAIRKLEMKLEKKRSSSMDKIMNKLRSAQKRAQDMRSSVLSNQAHQVTSTSHKAPSFRRTRQMGTLSGCFTCHAF
ncbi:uncharacterized protein LOC121241829 [Juglans microcarpa x Juglans regia]|uniref:uncharacterized protein LOC121241829 n=1 Tax=Juglans microcarpa x Juglans regia TaxID=2249226 RepID=UPI001B7DD785|nr:uncharacterized protein LOC121241829 [Juglans microcarpa x Juglans regia]XP_040995612.1 uncharacterized protein LOC121241829 [Juglans microcarpa x Juglans regia]